MIEISHNGLVAIHERLAAGETYADLSLEFGIGPKGLRGKLQRAGLEVRKKKSRDPITGETYQPKPKPAWDVKAHARELSRPWR